MKRAIHTRRFIGGKWVERDYPDAIEIDDDPNNQYATVPYSVQIALLIDGDDIYFLIANYAHREVYIYDPIGDRKEIIESIPQWQFFTQFSRSRIWLVDGVVYVNYYSTNYGNNINIAHKLLSNIFDGSAWSIQTVGGAPTGQKFQDFLVDDDGGYHLVYCNFYVSTAYHYYSSDGGVNWTTTDLSDGTDYYCFNYCTDIKLSKDGDTIYIIGGWSPRRDWIFYLLMSWNNGVLNRNVQNGDGLGNYALNQYTPLNTIGTISPFYAWGYENYNIFFSDTGETGTSGCMCSCGRFVINSVGRLAAFTQVHFGTLTYDLKVHWNGTSDYSNNGHVSSVDCDFYNNEPFILIALFDPVEVCPTFIEGDNCLITKSSSGGYIATRSKTLELGDNTKVVIGEGGLYRSNRSCPLPEVGDKIAYTLDSNGKLVGHISR